MRVYYDRDADVNLIKGKKVLVVGYGSQGHAHAMNLRDSGVKDVRIALKPGSATIKKAEGAGFTVMSPADGAKWADIVMVLTPDELQSDIYSADLAPNMRPGSALDAEAAQRGVRRGPVDDFAAAHEFDVSLQQRRPLRRPEDLVAEAANEKVG